MGMRFRKSVKLGGGFRVNISKSGIGYSWGVPGYRRTKKANGGTRTTYSLPGTGMSYVKEEGKNAHANTPHAVAYGEQAEIVSATKKTNALKGWGIALLIIGALLLIGSISRISSEGVTWLYVFCIVLAVALAAVGAVMLIISLSRREKQT